MSRPGTSRSLKVKRYLLVYKNMGNNHNHNVKSQEKRAPSFVFGFGLISVLWPFNTF